MANTDNILNDFVTKLSTISVANGYNTTPTYVGKVVKDMYEVSDFPQISVMFGDSEIKAEDDIASVFRESINMYVVGYVNSATDISEAGTLTTQAENLISDIKKAISSFITTNINSISGGYSGGSYFIDIHNTPIKIFRLLDDKNNVGMVSLNFRVVSYRRDSSFGVS